jgi:predicted alpha-1,2-mannosidase
MRRLIFPISLTAVFTAVLVYFLFFFQQAEQIIEPRSSQVDPLIGTDFHGHTHPAAIMPFGMVQLGPDTRLDGWDGCSAFHYSDSIIYGFSHTHLSGTGCSDYADILLMPFTKYNPKTENYEYTSLYNHKSATATPGFYSVMLEDYNTKVELTVSNRVGFHKYSFPNANERYVLLDLEHRDEVIETYLTQVSETRFVGLRRSRAWAEDQILYFVADFSEPVSIIEYQSDLMNKTGDEFIPVDTINSDNKSPVYYCGKNNKVIIKPVSNKNTELFVKVGLSATGEDGAIKNLEAEIPHWDFEKVKKDATIAWDKELSKIRVYGGSDDEQIIFYTALYHAFSAPNIYSDVDGSFRGTDLMVHTNPGHETYTVFSLWDTFRATHPLYTLIQQKRTLDFIKTFLDHYKYGGMLPVWELSANETYCMIGYHSVPVIVDAYFKGIKDFDHNLALKAMLSTAKTDELGKTEFAEYGYIPLDLEHESVSKTLEYAFDDWCIAMFARDLGKTDIYDEFIERSQFYKNIFNPTNGFMQAKLNGAWQTPFDPREVNYNFTEANSWQYSFFVPHDILTFIELHGGNEKFAKQLDLMFAENSETSGNHQADITGLIGQYAHGNEPSHHMAYLYNYCAQPWKTQFIVRKIMSDLYSSKPDGLCGNEDCGQMSAWYVMSALGFYPVNPASGVYDLGSPIFDTAIIQLENGRNFEIISHNNSQKNVYVQKVKLNGREYNLSYISHKTIMKGGKIEFFMGPAPEKNRGTSSESIYTSVIADNRITPVPFTNIPLRSFRGTIELTLACPDSNAEIFYSLDGDIEKNPVKYVKPIKIAADTELEAYAIAPGKKRSKIISAELKHIPDNRSISIKSKYSQQYSAGGDNALIDFVKGEAWFRSGLWQGYQGQDFEAVVDLKEVKEIKLINSTFLQDIKSWIFFPANVTFFASSDGVNYAKVFESKSLLPDDSYDIKVQEFKTKPQNLKARYIKVVATSYGKLPDWHLSAGNDSWLFIDEIEIL